MSVIKIVMDDKLPTDCYKCQLSDDKYDIGRPRCIPMSKAVDNYLENRPDWCPLVVDVSEVCEWKHEPMFDEVFFRNPHYHERKNFSVVPTIIQRNYYEFCPLCGKRIKYAEEE